MSAAPRVLFLTTDVEDYLADGLFLGLRRLLGAAVVDFPRADRLYVTATREVLGHIRGKAFTLYGLLPDEPVDRSHVFERMQRGEFDLVVLSRIWAQFGLYTQLLPKLEGRRVAVLDGEDTPAMYPYAGLFWRNPRLWTLPRAHVRFPYFKREWTPETMTYRTFKLLPPRLAAQLPSPKNLRGLAFSIPAEKIVESPVGKTREFASHVVDPEVAAAIGGKTSYAFESEAAYYADLRSARFGITTKRAGWDCLRHYEIAASGAVPCFRDLAQKPATCAPFGLTAGVNCLAYRSAAELLAQTRAVTDREYAQLQANALAWARDNSCTRRAEQFLAALGLVAPLRTAAAEAAP